jgi:hypothetical protein
VEASQSLFAKGLKDKTPREHAQPTPSKKKLGVTGKASSSEPTARKELIDGFPWLGT